MGEWPNKATQFSKDYQPEKNGRTKGSKNRSTIAKKWLETSEKTSNPLTGEETVLSQEDIMTLVQIKGAKEGDVNKYKALMDSAYGTANQKIEHSGEVDGGFVIRVVEEDRTTTGD
jgi:hypothetical protein